MIISVNLALLLLALIMVPSIAKSAKLSIQEGHAVKCNASQDTVYRYTDWKLRPYPSPAVASSWDPNWKKFIVIDCSGVPKGPVMTHSVSVLQTFTAASVWGNSFWSPLQLLLRNI